MESFAKETLPVSLEEEMRRSYLDYAMSVIVGRALPDVRDGLKPVHRRILYSMHEQGHTPDKKYVKSARVVGDVMGKYHPHGDQAIYDALVRMAQDFSMRLQLIDGQGNFGSVDGDPPAAMRYTECRLARPAMSLLDDIDKDTVAFQPNRIGPEIVFGRFFQHLAGANVEAAAVQRAFHPRALEETPRQRSLLVGAGVVGGVEAPLDVCQQDAPALNIEALHGSRLELGGLPYLDEIAGHAASLKSRAGLTPRTRTT